jgi:hypothetical protein
MMSRWKMSKDHATMAGTIIEVAVAEPELTRPVETFEKKARSLEREVLMGDERRYISLQPLEFSLCAWFSLCISHYWHSYFLSCVIWKRLQTFGAAVLPRDM